MGNKARSSPLIFQDNDPVILGGDETSTIQNDGTDLLITETVGDVTVSAGTDVNITATGNATIDAGTDVNITATGNATIDATETEITNKLTVSGTGANKRIIQVGSGEGALRFYHENTGGNAKIHIEPYYLGEWNEDKEYAFDAIEGEWTLNGNILRAPEVYYVNPAVNDHSSTSKGSFYKIVSDLATDSTATIIMPAGTYEFNHHCDVSAWEDLNFQWDDGAVFTQKTGDETVTFYKPTQLIFEERQNIGPTDMFVFTADIMYYGSVTVFPWVSASVSNVRTPEGLWLDVSSSTTQGLQEAIDYAFGDGTPGTASYNLEIAGRQKDTGGAQFFYISETLQFPAMRQVTLDTGGITIAALSNFSPVIQFDSMFQCNLDLNVEVDGGGGANVVKFYPENVPPGAGLVGILESNISFGTISQVNNPASPSPMIVIDGTNGYCGSTTYKFNEINGVGLSNVQGIAFINPNGHWCYNNKIIAPHIHACGVGLQVGSSGSDDSYLVNNRFEIGVYNYATGVGIDCYAENNTFDMHSFFDYNDGYTIRLATDVHWESSAKNNILVTPVLTSLIDDSDGSNRIITATTDSLDAFTFGERSSDPPNPAEGRAVMWMSDGTGSGDDGDIMIKITAGATTKTITLIDFSAF